MLYFYLWPGYARDPQDGMVVAKVTAPLYNSVEETVRLEMDFFRAVVHIGGIVEAAVLVKAAARRETRRSQHKISGR